MTMDTRGDSNLYIGFDESNHGKSPEVFVTSFSRDPKDIQERSIGKTRTHKPSFLDTISYDYTFMLLQAYDMHNPGYLNLFGNVLGSLIKDRVHSNDSLYLFVDGEIKHSTEKEIHDLKDIIANVSGINRSQLTLRYGPDFDRIYPIVNVADELAHYIFRKLTPEKMAENSHCVKLMRNYR